MCCKELKNNLRVFCQSMVEREKRGSPDWELTDQNNRSEKHNAERGDTERDWVDVMFESLAYDEVRDKRIYGRYYTKPSQNYVIESVVDWLGHMRDGRMHTPSLKPGGGCLHVELDRKQKADIDMITQGFMAVAYEHIHDGHQSVVHRHFRNNLNFDTSHIRMEDYGFDPISNPYPMEKREKLKTDAPLDEFRREFKDRFELTYEQAKAVQKIAKKVNLTYDPGGRELTPANIAKRTFRGKDYLHRPIIRGRRY